MKKNLFKKCLIRPSCTNFLTNVFNPRLTGGGGVATIPSRFFFSLPQPNQKESDLSHLGDLSDILRGHVDETNMGLPPYQGLG